MQPEAAALRLRAALDVLGLLPSNESEQRALTNSMLDYLGLLAKWNRIYNLTALREPEQMLVQHIFDSAAVVPALHRCVEKWAEPSRQTQPTIVDVGSGGGLPGIVIALLWPQADLVLVEPVAKKAAFLQQVVAELALTNVRVLRSRVEDLAATLPAPDVIVCRAFASLADYAQAVQALASAHTVVTAMKAAVDEAEKSALTNTWQIAEIVPLQVPELDARRSLVVLERAETAPRIDEQESQPLD